jgi:hypothetical protein
MPALEICFGFFNDMSMLLEDLLRLSEVVDINTEVHEQMVLAFLDLLTLVCDVSIHTQKTVNGLASSSVFMNLYETFASQIQTFRQRYENIRVSVYKQQLLRENFEEHKGTLAHNHLIPYIEKRKLNLTMGTVHTVLHSIGNWLVSDDPVLADLAKTSAHPTPSREEMTCLWIRSYLKWFLKSEYKTVCLTGGPGSGRSVLASVILDRLQRPAGYVGVSRNVLFVPISK